MSDNGKESWSVCSFCGTVTDYYQKRCPRDKYQEIPTEESPIIHNLEKTEISTEDLRRKIEEGLVVISNHSNSQIEAIMSPRNQKPPDL